MSLVAYKELPTFKYLTDEGCTVITPDHANNQNIRELHIGFLNMAPDISFEDTERQFFRLIGESSNIVQIHIHPFSLPEVKRNEETTAYIDHYYDHFKKIQEHNLDALVISGSNAPYTNLEKAPFWQSLQDVLDWAWNNVTSTLCSCLATHAIMQSKYGQKPSPLADDRNLWGIYRHSIADRSHPLVRNMNTVFDLPHSRFNNIDAEQFNQAGMNILIESKTAGVHMAVSPDGFRTVFMQGSPEYDTIKLLKEYLNEVNSYRQGQRDTPPTMPENYFRSEAIEKLMEYNPEQMSEKEIKAFNNEIFQTLDNTWTDSARSFIANWIALVYQTASFDISKQFMEKIDPENPLGI